MPVKKPIDGRAGNGTGKAKSNARVRPARKPIKRTDISATARSHQMTARGDSPRGGSSHVAGFAESLSHHMERHGDTHLTLLRAITGPGEGHANLLLAHWAKGKTTPSWPSSFELLHRIEQRYGLSRDYFRKLIQPEFATKTALRSVSLNQQHVLRWHLPEDFDSRPSAEQEKILAWVRRNVLTGGTEFGKFLQLTSQKRYSIRFSELGDVQLRKKEIARYQLNGGLSDDDISDENLSASDEAPPRLVAELDSLVRFKRATIALRVFAAIQAGANILPN